MHSQRHFIHHHDIYIYHYHYRHDPHHDDDPDHDHDDDHDHHAQYHAEVKGICRYVQLIREGGQAVSCRESLGGEILKIPKSSGDENSFGQLPKVDNIS